MAILSNMQERIFMGFCSVAGLTNLKAGGLSPRPAEPDFILFHLKDCHIQEHHFQTNNLLLTKT